MRRMFRTGRRPTRKNEAGEHVLAWGVRIGYWPCMQAPFIQIAIGAVTYEVWYGLPSLEQVESGDK